MRGHIGPAGRLYAWAYDRAMASGEHALLGEQRQALLAQARGVVVDAGAGTGANLPHYHWDQVSELVLVEPSAPMLARACRRAAALGIRVRAEHGPAEQLRLAGDSADTVVFTLSLCTIGDPAAALREARRVLRPDGRLLVLEHVRAAEPRLARWQDRLSPVWGAVSGGCRLNRDTRAEIQAAGFAFDTVADAADPRIPVALIRRQLIGVARPC
ncbi:MAG: class I SAM-dependent methyltransferase [Streptosporangiaceae bacterium]